MFHIVSNNGTTCGANDDNAIMNSVRNNRRITFYFFKLGVSNV